MAVLSQCQLLKNEQSTPILHWSKDSNPRIISSAGQSLVVGSSYYDGQWTSGHDSTFTIRFAPIIFLPFVFLSHFIVVGQPLQIHVYIPPPSTYNSHLTTMSPPSLIHQTPSADSRSQYAPYEL